MATFDETPYQCVRDLYEDGITGYDNLTKDKDKLIRFVTCMIENDRFEFIHKLLVDEFFMQVRDHKNQEARIRRANVVWAMRLGMSLKQGIKT
jgi:hypothetical protein